MVSQSYLIRLAAVLAVVNATPLPLNINLGAYSPALVVGDGAIGFEGGASGVESIMNTLQGAAASGAAAAAAPAAAPAAPRTGAPAAEAAVAGLGQKATAPSGILSEKASLPVPGANRALDPRSTADSEEVEEEEPIVPEAAADAEEEEDVEEDEAPLAKRQLAGFQASLAFAEGALTKGPKIQLGTEASGVGIIVENTPARAGAAE